MLDKILFLLDEKGFQQKDLTDFLGLHKNAVTDWKNGKSKSYTKYLYQIAEFFNVTPEYLVSDVLQKEKPGTDVTPTELNEALKKLSEILPNLSDEDKDKLIDYGNYLIQKQK